MNLMRYFYSHQVPKDAIWQELKQRGFPLNANFTNRVVDLFDPKIENSFLIQDFEEIVRIY